MNKQAKLITALAVVMAALMLLVPLAQMDLGGGYSNDADDAIILSTGVNSSGLEEVTTANALKDKLAAGTSVFLKNNLTLNLSDAITISGGTEGSPTTLDLGGRTLTINTIDDNNSNRLIVNNAANVKITNGTIIYKAVDSAGGKSPIRVGSATVASSAQTQTLTLDKVNIMSADYGVVVFSKGNLIVTDSSVSAVNSAISTNGSTPDKTSNSCDAKIILNGGQYTSTSTAAVFFPGGASLTVNGGTFTGKTGFDIRSGTTTISDATINVFGSSTDKKCDGTNGAAGGSGPTPWGMGIAVFNLSSYGQTAAGTYSDISVTVTNTEMINAVYKLYIGGYSYTDLGEFKANADYIPVHKCTVKLDNEEHCKITDVPPTPNKQASVLINGNRNSSETVPLTLEYNNSIFANGTAITISAVGEKNSKIMYGNIIFVDNFDLSKYAIYGGKKNVSIESSNITIGGGKISTVYGGGFGEAAATPGNVTTSNITINGGKISNAVYGGGLIYATVENSTVTMNGGYSQYIMGGGACSSSNLSVGTDDAPYISINGKATVNINGGQADYVMGGGQGYAKVNNAEITVSGNATITELIAGGSNGATDPTATITINSGTIANVFSVNRGSLKDPSITVNGGTITNLYVGASQNSSGTTGKVTGTATLKVTGGDITNIYLGTGLDEANISLELRDSDKLIVAGGHEYKDGEEFTSHDNTNKNSYIIVKNYTIATGKEWTINGGSIDLSGATLTNNGKLILSKIVVGDDGLVLNFTSATGNVSVKDTSFKTKGLYIHNAKDVTIENCTFNGINTDFSLTGAYMHHPAAIHVDSATGTVTISGNKITNAYFDTTDLAANGKFMGITITSNGATAAGAVYITDNQINSVMHNAIYMIGNFGSITIDDNVITEWACKDTIDKGRAIRLDIKSESAITIKDNTFIKKYSEANGFSNDGKYDDGNVLKATGTDDVTFTNNILALSGSIPTTIGDLFIGISEGNYLVIFDPNGGYFNTSSNPGVICSFVANDQTVTEPTVPTRSNHSFVAWYLDEALTTEWNVETGVTADTTLYAKWRYTGGSGTPITPPTPPVVPEEPIIPDDKGNAEIKVDEKKAEELVHEAVTSGSNSVTLVDKENIEGTVTSVTIPVSDLETISKQIENNENVNSVSIATSAGEVIIEKDVLNDIIENANAETIVVEVVDAKDQLNEEQKKTVGDNPVYDVNIRAGSEYIKSFNGKTITVSIPYELQPGEDPNNLVVYYLKDDGTVEKMKGTYKDGQVSFETDHLSKFVIAYEAQEPVTPDNPDKPAKEDNDNTIYYIVAAIVVILIIVALAYYFLKKKQ